MGGLRRPPIFYAVIKPINGDPKALASGGVVVLGCDVTFLNPPENGKFF
jgi:hypothetical protein